MSRAGMNAARRMHAAKKAEKTGKKYKAKKTQQPKDPRHAYTADLPDLFGRS